MNKLIKAIEIKLKWRNYRDTIKRFYLIDKEKGQKDYDEMIKMHQTIIQNYAKKRNIEIIPAITKICELEDGMNALKFLAAGYEILNKDKEKTEKI